LLPVPYYVLRKINFNMYAQEWISIIMTYVIIIVRRGQAACLRVQPAAGRSVDLKHAELLNLLRSNDHFYPGEALLMIQVYLWLFQDTVLSN